MKRRADALVATAVALVRLAVIEAGIRTSLPQLCRRLDVDLVLYGPVGVPGAARLTHRQHLRVRAAERALRWWPMPATCLRRSVLVAVMLPELAPVLRLGWRVDPPPAIAHAWLEVGGRSLDRDMRGIEALENRPSYQELVELTQVEVTQVELTQVDEPLAQVRT